MNDMFDRFRTVQANQYNETADKLMAYERAYAKLLKDYAPELREVESILRELRDEKNQFYGHDWNEIESSLSKIDYINQDVKIKWLEEMRDSMERSFKLSDSIINDFVKKTLDEFGETLRRELRKV